MQIKVTLLIIIIGIFTELITSYSINGIKQYQEKCPQISSGEQVGTVTSPSIDEASGLVASQTHSDVFWTMNDSDGPHCIYALNKYGQRILTLCLTHASNYDWEAISTAPCYESQPSEMCIFIGDIGDNKYVRNEIRLYKVKEPKNFGDFNKQTIYTEDWSVVDFHYPNNKAYNAESMLIDSKTREFIIVTKSSHSSKVFKTALDSKKETYNIMTDTGITLALSLATDATSSKDGQVIIIRQYHDAFFWPRQKYQEDYSILEILKQKECRISVGYQEQGESVALVPEGNSYYAHSEHVNQPFWKFDILGQPNGEKCSAGNTDKNCCSSSNKCDENQGDCDNDSDCKSGLKCGTDNCPAGFPDKTYDCCYNPNGNNPITSPHTGPAGAIFKYDLLKSFQGGRLGAFNTVNWNQGHVNNEVQNYRPENAVQDPSTGEITITAERRSNGKVYSARLESYGVWTTSQSSDIKYRGYVEIETLLPAKNHGSNFKGAWPAVWMLGTGNGHDWPRHGEIDIYEILNGKPSIHMALHSTNHWGAHPQKPPNNPFDTNADFTKNPLISGLEWNIQDGIGQIDLTWWFKWFDLGSQTWVSRHTTKSLFKHGGYDYYDFLNSFNGEGFSLLINLAEGGDFPGTQDVLVDGKKQYLIVKSAKAYGF